MAACDDPDNDQHPSLLKWAERIRPEKIRRLYKLEAEGMLDEEFLNEVFYAVYDRCQSILSCTEAAAGRVKCPCCGTVIQRNDLSGRLESKAEIMVCSNCSWKSTWGEFHSSYQGRHLFAGGAGPAIQIFVDSVPKAKIARDKMLMIDTLIHAYHWEATENPTKPVAVNMIVGNIEGIIDLLEKLAYNQNEIEMQRTKYAWEEQTRYADEKWHGNIYEKLLDKSKNTNTTP
jgi:hypothetical protein